MIDLDGFSFTYDGASAPTLEGVDLHIPEGHLALVTGRTGSGKSTLLRAVNGLVPHFTGGHVEGRAMVAGRDTRTHPPRELAEHVGVVGQDPLSGFVTDTVEEELAYGMEQLAIPPAVMRRRVEDTLDLLGIAGLRRRALRTLSGGEMQRVAIASVLTCSPRVLVLDEPTSALDPTAAEETLAAVLRLVHDLGVTVLAAEHRLERVVEYADAVVSVADGRVSVGEPPAMMRRSELAPPVVQLGRLAGWDPLPLSVRDARRVAGPLRDRLAAVPRAAPRALPPSSGHGLVAREIWVRYGSTAAVAGVDLELPGGAVVALMGRNGSGKSSLLWALHGAGPRDGGQVHVGDIEQSRRGRRRSAQKATGNTVALVPQQSGDLLYHASVADECSAADRAAAADVGTTRALLDHLTGDGSVADDAHPRDLSEGQRLALALAVQLVVARDVLLLDEPTRGLDYLAKHRLAETLRGLTADGLAVLVATHDVEFVAQVADRVVVLANGEKVSDGTTAEVLAGSPVFAPQVAKVLAPEQWLTVDEVAAALAVVPTGERRE